MLTDADWIEELERAQRIMLHSALRIVRCVQDAEDVLQNALLKAWLNRAQFKGNSKPQTWLISITRNEALMFRRRHWRDTFTDELTPELYLPTLPEDAPDEAFIREEKNRHVAALVEQLTPAKREAVEVYFGDGALVREVAVTLGISVPAVKGRIFHAKKEIRAALTAS